MELKKLWPSGIKKTISGKELVIEFNDKTNNKKNYRLLDPWSLAEWDDHKKELDSIRFRFDASTKENPEREAFKRRISYLKINNPISFYIEIGGKEESLLSATELFNRPPHEVIQPGIRTRKLEGAKKGKLEKDFQDWLYNHSGGNLNDRFAVFGEDFYQTRRKEFKVVREFPTGAFCNKVSKETRMLPTNFVDFVTKNKFGVLSIIELKINDPKLEVISQVLDYALFFRSYAGLINKLLLKSANGFQAPAGHDFNCYIVNNHYHPYFDKAFNYYGPNDEKTMKFRFKKITLGHFQDFPIRK